ncbi:MAG: protease inhibitor I42 family protein [Ginsengibacter sp.]
MPSGTTQEINLKTGETTSITLKGLTTAGYVWNYVIDGNKDCVRVSKSLAKLKRADQEKTGASADEIFVVKAKKKGTVYIHFSQHRSWEKNVPHANQETVRINIG